jgi:hypothetical protein
LTVGRSTTCQAYDIARIKWRRETGEHTGTQCSDDVIGSAVTRKDDALYSRPDGAHLFQKSKVFVDTAVGTGDYNSK